MKMSANPAKHEVQIKQYLHSILDISATPHPPLRGMDAVSIPSTEQFSVMVPSGGRLQGCHGYLLSVLNVTLLLPSQGTNAQAYLLLMRLTYLRTSFRIQPFQDFY